MTLHYRLWLFIGSFVLNNYAYAILTIANNTNQSIQLQILYKNNQTMNQPCPEQIISLQAQEKKIIVSTQDQCMITKIVVQSSGQLDISIQPIPVTDAYLTIYNKNNNIAYFFEDQSF
ncbi:hypothetical protein EKK58_07185 [Candidatus Dependentiae bacterium]|nr:MAG: hypothetical protein EKK58_07185 [Candidatus Dependentiae bacterium]